ncbi:MAG TPA: hypothetical protein VMW78_01925 [Anaerolineae bacterium]|nr:hypothetical protein [Anaerolineae bacterium]
MGKEGIQTLNDRTICLLIGVVFLMVLAVLAIVFSHDRVKPKTPQAMVAAAFSQMFINEWKPGMGKQPLAYHPAAFNNLVWRPLSGGQTAPATNNLYTAAQPMR